MGQRGQAQDRWREAIVAQRKSGLSIKEFCERRKLSGPGFFVWRKRLRMVDGETAGSGANGRLCGNKEEARATKGFMRLMPPVPSVGVGGPEVDAAIRITTPNGYMVEAGYKGDVGIKSVLGVIKCL